MDKSSWPPCLVNAGIFPERLVDGSFFTPTSRKHHAKLLTSGTVQQFQWQDYDSNFGSFEYLWPSSLVFEGAVPEEPNAYSNGSAEDPNGSFPSAGFAGIFTDPVHEPTDTEKLAATHVKDPLDGIILY